MRDQRPLQTARRRIRQQDREFNGVAVKPCILCIQEHHTSGRHNDPFLKAAVCEMHHRAIHEQIRQADISLRYEPNGVKRVASALRSAAIYDHARAEAMERWADLLDNPEETK